MDTGKASLTPPGTRRCSAALCAPLVCDRLSSAMVNLIVPACLPLCCCRFAVCSCMAFMHLPPTWGGGTLIRCWLVRRARVLRWPSSLHAVWRARPQATPRWRRRRRRRGAAVLAERHDEAGRNGRTGRSGMGRLSSGAGRVRCGRHTC